jgi:hypothetical protein
MGIETCDASRQARALHCPRIERPLNNDVTDDGLMGGCSGAPRRSEPAKASGVGV